MARPKGRKLSPKQMKIARAAPPFNRITGRDFAVLRQGRRKKKR
tara:strand:- start:9668 stop:9799 length:132 start_codon:yes stop_codon:yes gene_type:complete